MFKDKQWESGMKISSDIEATLRISKEIYLVEIIAIPAWQILAIVLLLPR